MNNTRKQLQFLSVFFYLISSLSFGQNQIEHITPEQLVNELMRVEKPAVIQFWVPNCENALEIVKSYGELEKEYSKEIQFYFIGITDKPELIQSLITQNQYRYILYIAEPKSVEINGRKSFFAEELCKLLKIRNKDFNTMYLDAQNKVVEYNKSIVINSKKLQKIESN